MDSETLRSLEPDTPKRLTKQVVAVLPTKLGHEILKISRRRLFVAFQPKQPCDFIRTERSIFRLSNRKRTLVSYNSFPIRIVSDAKLCTPLRYEIFGQIRTTTCV